MNLTPEMEDDITSHIVFRRLPVFRFRPQVDITAYELARVIEMIVVSVDSVEGLPEDVRRHFVEEDR